MKSIRSFLLSRLLGGTALVLVGAGVVVYFAVTRSLEAQFDSNLSDRVKMFASILFQQEDNVQFEFSGELMPEYERKIQAEYFELWFRDGRILERSESLAEGDLEIPGEIGFEPVHWTAPLPDGREGRYVARLLEVHHVYPEEGPDRPEAAVVIVAVARGRGGLVRAGRVMLVVCLSASLALIGLIGVLSWNAVRKGMEPTHRLAATLDAIRAHDLPDRLEVDELPRELRPVARTTDALIQRVDAALKRERRTAADIAHELRTPISELVTVAEVALRNGHDPELTRKSLGTIRDVAWRMGHSVSTLLKLARLEMGAETFERADVPLGEMVRELERSLAAIERERGVRLEIHVDERGLVQADRDVLRIIVSNLLSNALSYVPRQGAVQCRLSTGAEWWRFVVENAAESLRPEDLSALPEPFWKKDGARTDGNRSGLGLALSCALAERTGLRLDFELDEGVFRAILEGPSALVEPTA